MTSTDKIKRFLPSIKKIYIYICHINFNFQAKHRYIYLWHKDVLNHKIACQDAVDASCSSYFLLFYFYTALFFHFTWFVVTYCFSIYTFVKNSRKEKKNFYFLQLKIEENCMATSFIWNIRINVENRIYI